MTVDFYDLLGVDRDASQEEVRRAFREQVREYHPDRNDDPRAPAQFTAIKKAYETLGDPDEREDYDRMGHNSYCANRITHLPSPEQWQLPDSSAGDGRSVAPDGNESTDSTDDSETDRAGTASGDRSTRSGKAAGSAGGSSRSRSRSSSRANSGGNATGSAASAAAAGSSPGATRGRSGGGGSTAGETDPITTVRDVAGRVQGASIGWSLILFSDALYLVGLAMYFAYNSESLDAFVDESIAAATGPGSVVDVPGTTYGIVPLSEYVATNVTAGSVVGGALLILGMAFLPSVYFFIIRETRRIRTPWQPSYLYVLGAFGPITGLVANAMFAPSGLYLEVICYVALPLTSVLGLPFSAFVRPRILRILRKTRHRLTN